MLLRGGSTVRDSVVWAQGSGATAVVTVSAASSRRPVRGSSASRHHRLDRLQQLLGVDWHDGEELLELHFAVRARQLLD